MPTVDLDKGGRRPQVVNTYLGPTKGWTGTDAPTYLEYVIGATGGNFITPGYAQGLLSNAWLKVYKWALFSNAVGDIEIDIWKIAMEDYIADQTPPTVSESICGGNYPRLSGENAAEGDTSGWTTEIDQNDFLGFNVRSAAALPGVTLILFSPRLIGQWSAPLQNE